MNIRHRIKELIQHKMSFNESSSSNQAVSAEEAETANILAGMSHTVQSNETVDNKRKYDGTSDRTKRRKKKKEKEAAELKTQQHEANDLAIKKRQASIHTLSQLDRAMAKEILKADIFGYEYKSDKDEEEK